MERASILMERGNTVLAEHLYFPYQIKVQPLWWSEREA
jgi:hypothetical protein